MTEHDGGLPVEQFIQALTSQLDRAQDALALKAHVRPLTFAVKDLSLDLRAHFDMLGGVVTLTPAGPGAADASTLHLSFTTITRPMIEENTPRLTAQPDEPSLQEALGGSLTPEEQRRLEWAGVHTLSQLRELQNRGGEAALEQVSAIPVLRLRAALQRASLPFISQVSPVNQADGSEPMLRIQGGNLVQAGNSDVRIGGEPVRIVRSQPREILVAPQPNQWQGDLTIRTGPEQSAKRIIDFDKPNGQPRAEGAQL